MDFLKVFLRHTTGVAEKDLKEPKSNEPGGKLHHAQLLCSQFQSDAKYFKTQQLYGEQLKNNE